MQLEFGVKGFPSDPVGLYGMFVGVHLFVQLRGHWFEGHYDVLFEFAVKGFPLTTLGCTAYSPAWVFCAAAAIRS